LYFGNTSEEEKGCKTRPNSPRFCNVLVVIGDVLGVSVGETAAGASGAVVSLRSCAGKAASATKQLEKMMAGRIIDGLNTEM
jgi:hypothetical protein